jgi:hypothetical protein
MGTLGANEVSDEFVIFSSALGGPAGQRHKAQLAAFSWCKNYDFYDLESFFETTDKRPFLAKIVANVAAPTLEIRHLLGMNIGPAALFPDLEGACIQSNMYEYLAGRGGHEDFE